jgi:hypothetical protein
VTEISVFALIALMVQTAPVMFGQFPQPPKVPLVAAVRVIGPVPNG